MSFRSVVVELLLIAAFVMALDTTGAAAPSPSSPVMLAAHECPPGGCAR